LLDGRQPFVSRRDLDEDVGAADPLMELVRHQDRPLGVVCHAGQHLDAHVAVLVPGSIVDGLQHVGRHLDVFDHQAEEDFLVRLVTPDQGLQRVVIVTASADRLLEDRRIRGHADHGILVDHPLQLARRHQAPTDVVEPDAGALLLEFE